MRTWAMAAVVVANLAGCGAGPQAPGTREAERTVSQAKSAAARGAAPAARPAGATKAGAGAATPGAKAVSAAKAGAVTTGAAIAGAGTTAPAPNTAAAATSATTVGAEKAGGPKAAPARVAVLATPRTAPRVFPIRSAEGVLLDFRLDPPDGRLAWRLDLPAGVAIGKVELALAGVPTPVTATLTPAQVGLAARASGAVEVRVPLDLLETGELLDTNRDATAFTATATLYDEAGEPLADVDGRPLALVSKVKVQ